MLVAGCNEWDVYTRALAEQQGMQVVSVDGDGNCFFRSISHQVYGTDEWHGMVRARCMDYMEVERAFFEPFVSDEDITFEVS